jgi:isopenicillin N synthase-like dioxygenase
MQVISNGKLKSVDQRVVTNSKVARTTVGICIFPSSDSRIEPAKDLVDKCHPPLYKSFICKDFSDTYISEIINGITTERYKLHLSE